MNVDSLSMRYLFFENEHVAVLGLAAVFQAIQPGVDVQHVQVLGAHVAGVLGPDDLVLVDVEALEAQLVVARAAVPLLASDRAVAIRTVEDRDDEDQGQHNPPRSVQHRSHLCIILHWSVRASETQIARAVAQPYHDRQLNLSPTGGFVAPPPAFDQRHGLRWKA